MRNGSPAASPAPSASRGRICSSDAVAEVGARSRDAVIVASCSGSPFVLSSSCRLYFQLFCDFFRCLCTPEPPVRRCVEPSLYDWSRWRVRDEPSLDEKAAKRGPYVGMQVTMTCW
jgi:hypothetical protein